MITLLLCVIIVILLAQSEGGRSCLGALAILIGVGVLFTLLAVST
jgi:hypothetical protein